MSEALIEVEDLRVTFAQGKFKALRGVSFSLGREKLGIVGKSGSGKSTVGRAIMRLLPPSADVTARRLHFGDLDLLRASETDMMAVRGGRIGLILQDPKYSLNPLIRVGEQIAETYRQHYPGPGAKRLARAKALEMLNAVKIRDPERVMRLFPHEVSGGMGQRIMIAMMLVAGPEVLIADEPTSALDVTVRLEVLALLDELITHRNLGLVFISHDLNLVRRFCDRVLIMYAGRIVETLKASELGAAKHPYTQGLLASLPTIEGPPTRLPTLTRDPTWAREPAGEAA